MSRAPIRVMLLSYVLPLRSATCTAPELADYLTWLALRVELIVIDGSNNEIFERHRRQWANIAMIHVQPDCDLHQLRNGKVAGVLTGVRRASHEFVVIADDDVRYDAGALGDIASWLERADVVRPQNYFSPCPWHAYIDTARSLLNRVSGGDWPGTLGVRKAMLIATGGYDGDALFENLELVRTVIAAGGSEVCALGLYIRRLPASTRHFWSQRIRQAYDEFARPWRLCAWLAIAPIYATLALAGWWWSIIATLVAIVAAAEVGRRRAAGTRVFPVAATLASPLWVCERAVCAWLAIAANLAWGGIPYRGRTITLAANSVRVLQARLRRA